MHARTVGMGRNTVATLVAVLLTVVGVATPARATTADAPSAVIVSQTGLVVSAAVSVPEGETVGTVTATIGSDSPVSVSEVGGAYPVTLTRSDFGKSIVFSATATADGLDESAAADSSVYTFRSAVAPTSVSVSQSGLTLTATPSLATGTTLGSVTAQVGTAVAEVVNATDGVYSITLPRSDLGKNVIFSATANETGYPESDATSASPFTFAATEAPSAVTVTQSGLVFTAHITVGGSQSIGGVTVQVGSAEPETVSAVGGNYSKTIDRADLGKSVTFWATATESGKAESSTTASSAFTSASALAPSAVTVTQTGLVVTGHVTVGVGDAIGVVTVKVGDGSAETLTSVNGVYSKTLTRADLGSSIVFSATATSTDLPESDPTVSEAFTFSAATAPSNVSVTQSGLVVTGHVTVDSGASVGTVVATVGSADPVTVSAVDGDYPLTLTRADAGKSVVFAATATTSGKAVSDSTSSDAFAFALAAAPTAIVVTQNNLTVSAAVTFADGTTSGGVTAKVGTASPFTVSPVDGAYGVTLTRADLGKNIVFTAVGSATGLPDSDAVSSAPFTFVAATAPTAVTVSRDGLVLSAQIDKSFSQEIGTVTVQIGTASPVVVEAVEGQYSTTLTRADLNKDVIFRATVTEVGKAESSVTASDAYNISTAAAPTSVTVSQNGLVVTADVHVALGQSVGTVTVQVGSSSAESVTAVGGLFAYTLTRDDLGKTVVFSATATQLGKEESDATVSDSFVFAAATAPSAVTVTQSDLTVSASVTVASGDSVAAVTATVGDAEPVAISFVDGAYSLLLTRDDLGKSVTFTATAASAGKAISEPTSSSAFTFSAATAPSSVNATQNGLTVTADITVATGDAIGNVTATVGGANPVAVTPVGNTYSLQLTRGDAGKNVVFSATATASGKAESSATVSDALTFALASAPTSISVSQDNLTVSAAVTFAEGTAAGTVTATVGSGSPVVVTPADGLYSVTLTRADLGKEVLFSAVATQAGLPNSDSFTSDPFTFAAAGAPSVVSASQNGLVVSAAITVAEGNSVGTVKATVGSASPVVVTPVDDSYSIELSRSDAGKSVVFSATATVAGKAESTATSSSPITFAVAAAPTSISVSQSELVVSAAVTFAQGTTAGPVTATVGSAEPVAVDLADGFYSVTLSRSDLGKSVVFSALATQNGLPDSDSVSSSPFTFSSALAPSVITLTQSGLFISGSVTVAQGNAIGTVTATVGDADPIVVAPVDGIYRIELARTDAGKVVTFAATATASGKAESESTSSSPLTFGLAASPTAIDVTQSGLTVSAAVTFAQGTSAGLVTATVGDAEPVTIAPVNGLYSVTLTRADLTKIVTFSAVATQSGLPDSEAFSSEPFTFAAAEAPSAVTATQNGLVVTAGVTVVEGSAIGTVTATVGEAAPVLVTPVNGIYSIELTRGDAGKNVLFNATATSSGKAVSDATSSEPLTFALAAAPTAIVVTQDNLTVSAAVTFAEGTSAGSVTATVGSTNPVSVSAVDGIYSITLTRADLGKVVVFRAIGTQAGLPDSDALESDSFTFSAADAPSSVTATQNGLLVTANVTVVDGSAIGTVTATIGSAVPVVVTPVDDTYSVELTRGDAGKSVTFAATATVAGKAESSETSSSPLTFTLTAAPTSISVSQSELTVSADVTFAQGTSAGVVTVTVGDADPIAAELVDGKYSSTLTREDLGKSVVFSATATKDGLPDSDSISSAPFTFSAAAAPSAVVATQSALVVTASITTVSGTSVGTVTATIGDADPIVVTPASGVYSVELTRADAGTRVVFSATAVATGKAESDAVSSNALNFGLAAAPTAITVTQSELTVSAEVTFAQGTSAGAVTVAVGEAEPTAVSLVDGLYSVNLTRADLTKTVTFSAVASQAGLPDSEPFASEPYTFVATDAPSAVTASQNGLIVTASISVADGSAISTVTATVGDASPVVVTPVAGVYSIELARSDAGKSLTFSATASSSGKAESDSVSSEPLTFALAAVPTAIAVTQDNLTVSAAVTFADGTTAGTVTAKVGNASPVTVMPTDDVYSITLTRGDLGKNVTFTAVGMSEGLPDSDPLTSDSFTFSAADAPRSVTLSQNGYVVTADVSVAEGDAVGTVTATVSGGQAVVIEPSDGVYSIELTGADFGRTVTFSATANSSGKAESESTTSESLTFVAAAKPTAIVVTQDNLTVSAAVTFAVGTTPGPVTATIGDSEAVVVEATDDLYSVLLTREDLGKSVVFSATATVEGLPDSEALNSAPLTFAAASVPSAVTLSQSGLVVTAEIAVASGSAIGSVTAIIGDAEAITVEPVDGIYSIELTRSDAGTTVVFSATATAIGKAESDSVSSDTLTFGLAAAPTAISVTQSDLTLSAVVTFAQGTTAGTVTATVGEAEPVTVSSTDGSYSLALTREDLGKDVVFAATSVATGLPESEPFTSEPFNFAAAIAPSSVTLSQSGYFVTADVALDGDAAIGTVTAAIGDAEPVVVEPVGGLYHVQLTRADAQTSVVFSATATTAGKAESERTTSDALTFAIAEAPTSIVVTQSDLTVSAVVTFAEGTSAGAVTATVGGATAVLVEPIDDTYTLTLTRADLGKNVVFSAVGTAEGLPDSDVVTSDALTFSAAEAPSAVTLTQAGLNVTAEIAVAEGSTIGMVTATIGSAQPVIVEPTDDTYTLELSRTDAGKSIVFSATALVEGLAESDSTSSDPLTFAVAAAPTAIVVSQTDLVVSATVTFAEGTTPGDVTVTVGDADPVVVDPTDDVYSVELTRENLGSIVTFTALGLVEGLPESDPFTSDAFTFSAAQAPTSISVTQSGYAVTAHIELAPDTMIGTVTAQIGDGDAVSVDPVDGEYTVALDSESVDQPVTFTATALADGKAESEPTSSDAFTLVLAEAPTSVTVTQNGAVFTANIEVGAGQTIGTVTATVGDAEPVVVDPVDGIYGIEVTREDIGSDVTFSATAVQDGLIESAPTMSEAVTVGVSEAPTSVTLAQSGMDVVATIELPDGVAVGTVTASVDGSDPIPVSLVNSSYTLTLERTDFDKPVIFSVSGISESLLESEPVASEELTFQVSASPKTLYVSQSGLTLRVAGIVQCGTDPVSYGTLQTITMSVNGSEPETLTTIRGRATKTLTRSELGQDVVVTGTGVCGDLPESDAVARDPYTFRVAPSPTSIAVRQIGLSVLARPVLSPGEKIGTVTVSIDGGPAVPVTKSAGAYRVELVRSDLGKSLVFAATATLSHAAESDPAISDAYILSAAQAPSSISVTQVGLKMKARVFVPSGQRTSAVSVSVGSDSPVVLKASMGTYSVLLTRSDFGKSVVFTAVSTKAGLADSDPLSSDSVVFAVALDPVSISLTQSGRSVSAQIVVPDGQAIGAVYASIDGGSRVRVRPTASGYVKRLARSSIGKSVVFYVTSRQAGKADSDILASSPLITTG